MGIFTETQFERAYSIGCVKLAIGRHDPDQMKRYGDLCPHKDAISKVVTLAYSAFRPTERNRLSVYCCPDCAALALSEFARHVAEVGV